jgi:large subunit ribosomal protein L23
MDNFMPLKPRVSEKSYGLSQTRNTFVFVVPGDANKITVAEAVATQFKVTVEDVNIVVAKGKTKRSYNKRSRGAMGQRSDVKKAYVRLKAGDSIPVFAALDEAAAEADKAEKKEKK